MSLASTRWIALRSRRSRSPASTSRTPTRTTRSSPQRDEAGNGGAHRLPAVTDDHREREAVEIAGLGRLRGVEVAVAVEPHESDVVGADAGHDRLLAVTVAGEDDGQDAVRARGGHLTRELPVQIEAGRDLGRARGGERDPAHVFGGQRGRCHFRERQRPGAHAVRFAAHDVRDGENASGHGRTVARHRVTHGLTP
jgi:hypothetical protein